MLPFTPRRKDNLAAWMVARSDAPHYGRLIVFQFPKQKVVFGPRQVVARINQDQIISPQITLWNQQGSEVIQGTLLVIPIEESLIYVRPLYLRSQGGKIPELKRVIVAYQRFDRDGTDARGGARAPLRWAGAPGDSANAVRIAGRRAGANGRSSRRERALDGSALPLRTRGRGAATGRLGDVRRGTEAPGRVAGARLSAPFEAVAPLLQRQGPRRRRAARCGTACSGSRAVRRSTRFFARRAWPGTSPSPPREITLGCPARR